MANKLYFYVVYWRNKNFIGTRYKPSKVGSVLGMKCPSNKHCGFLGRAGFLKKTGDFKIVEKYVYLGRMTRSEFKKWILDDRT